MTSKLSTKKAKRISPLRLLSGLLMGMALLLGGLIVGPTTVLAQSNSAHSGLPLPRFVSLRANEVNMRVGPGVRYPIDWVYQRRHMPVEIINESGTWRKVRDFRGGQGWVHQSMLTGRRSLVVTGQMRTLRQEPNTKAAIVARAEPGVVGNILACPDGSGWCRVKVGDLEGWLRRVEFWGVYSGESIR